MSTRTLTRAVLVVAATTLVGLVVVNLNAQDPEAKPCADGAAAAACPAGGAKHACMRVKRALAENYNAIEKSLDAAATAVKAGRTKVAQAELAKAKDLLAKGRLLIRTCCRPAGAGAPVNVRCPMMMDSGIDPEKVPANLRRQFKGRTVGFCCGRCPAKWDKLTDEQKAERLAPALPKVKVINTTCPMRGSKIDPANVPADLTRPHGDGVVGFCCPGCPVAWAKLSDEQKKAKLVAAAAK